MAVDRGALALRLDSAEPTVEPVGPAARFPLEVWGPTGTRDMMNHMQETFACDIHMRRDVDEKAPADGVKT
jgi:hypothetical protein